DEGGVEAGVGIHHEKNGFEPGRGGGIDWDGIHADLWAECQCHETCDHEKREQAYFRDGENVTELIASGDAAIVHSGKESDENNENSIAGRWFCHLGEEFGQINDEKVCHGGGGGDARQPSQPAILNSKK